MLLIMEDKNIDDLIEITQDSRTVLNYPLEFVEPFKNYLIDSFKIKRILENKITLIDVDIHGNKRGYISFSLVSNSTIEVNYLFVSSKHQRQNVGYSLLNECENISKKFNVNKIVIAAETRSINFYFKQGYILTDRSLKSSVIPEIFYPYVEKYLN